VKEILHVLLTDMTGEALTPAAAHLFQVNPEVQKLELERKELFHQNVAKLLFLSKRARLDLQTAVVFLGLHESKGC
jgi:hypothetical protein